LKNNITIRELIFTREPVTLIEINERIENFRAESDIKLELLRSETNCLNQANVEKKCLTKISHFFNDAMNVNYSENIFQVLTKLQKLGFFKKKFQEKPNLFFINTEVITCKVDNILDNLSQKYHVVLDNAIREKIFLPLLDIQIRIINFSV
jgi:hypothetical protein